MAGGWRCAGEPFALRNPELNLPMSWNAAITLRRATSRSVSSVRPARRASRCRRMVRVSNASQQAATSAAWSTSGCHATTRPSGSVSNFPQKSLGDPFIVCVSSLFSSRREGCVQQPLRPTGHHDGEEGLTACGIRRPDSLVESPNDPSRRQGCKRTARVASAGLQSDSTHEEHGRRTRRCGRRESPRRQSFRRRPARSRETLVRFGRWRGRCRGGRRRSTALAEGESGGGCARRCDCPKCGRSRSSMRSQGSGLRSQSRSLRKRPRIGRVLVMRSRSQAIVSPLRNLP